MAAAKKCHVHVISQKIANIMLITNRRKCGNAINHRVHILDTVIRIAFVAILLTGASRANAQQTFNVDFSSPTSYIESLNIIRTAIGEPMHNVSYRGQATRVFRINPVRDDRLPIMIRIVGLDPSDPRAMENIQFVVDPTNLYLAGFYDPDRHVYTRFTDPSLARLIVPGHPEVVTLAASPRYDLLESIARLGDGGRTALPISRYLLLGDMRTALLTFRRTSDPPNANQGVATAMLRFATVISEAIRFRQIQRNFRETLDGSVPYRMSAEDVALTNAWDPLSRAFPLLSARDDDGDGGPDEGIYRLEGGGIGLTGARTILATMGMILADACRPGPAMLAKGIASNQCVSDAAVVVGHTAWNRGSLAGAVSASTSMLSHTAD